jgi:hypothetical protein
MIKSTSTILKLKLTVIEEKTFYRSLMKTSSSVMFTHSIKYLYSDIHLEQKQNEIQLNVRLD